MGRPVGDARAPIRALTADEKAATRNDLAALGVLDGEPRGWSTGQRERQRASG